MQDIVVKRIDEGLGLVLEVPSEPTVSPGFVHISNIADTKIDKLQQVRQCDDICTSNSVRTAVKSIIAVSMITKLCAAQGANAS